MNIKYISYKLNNPYSKVFDRVIPSFILKMIKISKFLKKNTKLIKVD